MSEDQITVRVEGDQVVVIAPGLLDSRSARMFFRAIMGANTTENGWRCPRRRKAIPDIVVRINTYLESQGLVVHREGRADTAVNDAIARKRSFERTRTKASALREGRSAVEVAKLHRLLERSGWDHSARNLRDHQIHGAIHALAALNAANFSVPGSGKTVTTLAAVAAHLAASTIDLVLVVGPLACFSPWESETQAALPGRLRARRIRGTAQQRRALYGTARRDDLLLTSFASAAADRVAIKDFCRSFRVMLVVDESHRIKRFRGGLWAPSLIEIAEQAKVRVILTGTPMPQSGRDLYSQLNVLWPRKELTGPRGDFATRVDQDFGSVLDEVLPFISRTPKSALGLPGYSIEYHSIPLTGIQAEVYELIENRFRRILRDANSWLDMLDTLRRGRPIRLLQAAANPDLFNKNDRYFGVQRFGGVGQTLMERLASYRENEIPAKSRAGLHLVERIVARGEKVVCWSNFVSNLDQFRALVEDELDIPCFQIDGRVPTDDDSSDDRLERNRENAGDVDTREAIIETFLGIEGGAVLVTNPASCSESISLHRSCHNAIYMDRTYDCALYLQSIDRIHRLGLPEDARVAIHVLLATFAGRDTIDQLVDSALRGKEAKMRELLEGAQLQPLVLSDDPLDDAEGSEGDLENLLRFLLGEGS